MYKLKSYKNNFKNQGPKCTDGAKRIVFNFTYKCEYLKYS